ncbi:MAG: hypothetical protein WCS73_05935 [Lentisphaeria bacterium]
MKKQFIQAVELLTRFHFSCDKRTEEPVLLFLFVVRCLLGLAMTAAAGLMVWMIKDGLIAAALGVALITILHSYITKGKENRVPLSLLLSFRKKEIDVTVFSEELLYQQGVATWCLAIRPLLLFFLLFSGQWYWVLIVFSLGDAIGLETVILKNNLKESMTSVWILAAVISFVVILLGDIAMKTGNAVLAGMLAFMIAWLLPHWFKLLPVKKLTFEMGFYLGEIAVTVVLLCFVTL